MQTGTTLLFYSHDCSRSQEGGERFNREGAIESNIHESHRSSPGVKLALPRPLLWVSGMKLPQWCMMGVMALLLLCEIVVSQLWAFPYPLCSDPPAGLQPRAPSDGEQPNHDPASLVNSHKHISPAAPSCTLSFPNSRIHAVGIFMSSLLLVSLCVSYFLEIISFMVKPHPVQRPLLPVVVGAWSLLQKMLLFVMDCSKLLDKKTESCSHAESERHLEINHKVCAAEESRGQEEEELSVPFKVQTAAHNCLHSGALVLCNPGTPNLPDLGCKTELQLLEIGEGESSAAYLKRESPKHHPCMGHPDYQNKPECSSVCKLSSGRSCRWPHCLLSFVFGIQGLLTSLLALINSLVTALVVPQLLHSSGACSVLVYLDPGLSLLAVITLIVTSLPQVYRYGMMLLQASPPNICVSDVGQRIASVPGVQAVHDLHIWQLTESLTVASVHVHCYAGLPFNRWADLMSGVTKVLQNVGVSCCTIQPEITSSSSPIREDEDSTFIHREDPSSPFLPPCSLACGKACAASMCCSLLEEKKEEIQSTQRPTAGETTEEPQTLVIENTFF
ncbi:zinc/cadmium resistance protein isoform X2 [Girardinichthys multiradiatus]|uniref:zinc/cadmium resistance protein isoform X2 n=1 Tax=Girardinichthys multiradiatus TaxID=208333 RepID=UPI001FACD148|nr:zinc/cadmium resistance protein isoform X2 [Girardinichthys multiradiatus]